MSIASDAKGFEVGIYRKINYAEEQNDLFETDDDWSKGETGIISWYVS